MITIRGILRKLLMRGQLVNPTFCVVSVVVLVAVFVRFFISDADDPFKCNALLTRGHWFGREQQSWQPPGCMLHEYSAKDIFTCLHSRRIILAGDSTVRQIYWTLAKKVDASGAKTLEASTEKHDDIRFQKNGVELIFLWDPYMNSTSLYHELAAYNRRRLDIQNANTTSSTPPSMIIIGGGLWFARYIEDIPVAFYQNTINNVSQYLPASKSSPRFSSPLRRLSMSPSGQDLVVVLPVLIPIYESLTPDRAKSMTPGNLTPMNSYLKSVQAQHHASAAKDDSINIMWTYLRMTEQQPATFETDGLHLRERVASIITDLLLNFRCNSELVASDKHTSHRTCCTNYRNIAVAQGILLFITVGIVPVLCIAIIITRRRVRVLPSSQTSQALLVISLALCYCLAADRTQLFNKIQKQYSTNVFAKLGWVVLALGVLSVRRSAGVSWVENKPGVDHHFLSRDQTDEWKGWMQLIILIYHYTGASKNLAIYKIIRLLVASYLFMTGFGHTAYFLAKNDYSLRRVTLVLIRLNLLSCLLPYIMHTDYLFYYFAPLSTFWFLVVYATLRTWRSRNTSTIFLLGKIGFSLVLTTAMIRVPGILEAIFSVLRSTCRIDWDVTEWRFRVLLDMYIVYTGMSAAIVFSRIKGVPANNCRQPCRVFIQRHVRVIRVSLVLVAACTLGTFWVISRRFSDKRQYNFWHPFIAHFPILAFILLRNVNQHLRNCYSSIFAWFGRCSLETFTLQFHIWLAGDTKGLLSTGLFGDTGYVGRIADFVVLTSVFLWVSWQVTNATSVVTNWIVGPSRALKGATSETANGADLELPRLNHGRLETAPIQHIRRKGGMLRRLIPNGLQLRLLFILTVMWLANWTYK